MHRIGQLLQVVVLFSFKRHRNWK